MAKIVPTCKILLNRFSEVDTMARHKTALGFLGVTVLLVAAAIGAVVFQQVDAQPSVASHYLEHPAAILIDSPQDAIGAFTWFEDERIEIKDLVWGISLNGDITIALFRGIMTSGEELVIDQVDRCERLALSVDELAGGYMWDKEGNGYLVEELEYAVSVTGDLITTMWSGWDAEGHHFAVGSRGMVPFTICCQKVAVQVCRDLSCNGSCPGPTDCVCTGSGECALVTFQDCMGPCGDPDCPPGNTCEGTPPHTACECV